jgi:hypothetical protein
LLSHVPQLESALQQLQKYLITSASSSKLTVDSDFTMVLDLLHPYTNWELMLEMAEPSLDIVEKEKMTWLEWFDGLKTHHDLIQGFI